MTDGWMHECMNAFIKSSNHSLKILTKQLFCRNVTPVYTFLYSKALLIKADAGFQPTGPRHSSRYVNQLTFFFPYQSLKIFVIRNQSLNLITSEWTDKNKQSQFNRPWTTSGPNEGTAFLLGSVSAGGSLEVTKVYYEKDKQVLLHSCHCALLIQK